MLTSQNKLNVLMQRFHAMSTPKHNSKDLRVFLTEYRKIKHQLSRIVDFQANELVIKSVVVRKLPFQRFDRICDIYVTHDFTLDQLETGIQHIVDKLEQATLALAEGSVVKPVGVETQSRDLPSRQSRNNTNQKCSYCSGEHPAHKCSKYRTIQSRKDRLVKLRLCYCCLSPGHSSKMCHSSKTCRSCGGAHHSSLCYKSRGNNSSNSENSNQSNSSSQGKTGSSSSSSHHSSSANTSRAQAQSHPTNKPVVTPSRSSSSQANVPSPNLDTTYVTNVKSSNFPNNVLPTATLKVSYCNEQANVRAFFDTGSHRSIGISHCFKTLDYYLILMCMHLEFPNNNFLLIMFLLKYSNTNQCFFLYIQMLINVSSLFNWPMTHKDVDFTNKPISLVLGQLGV